LSDSAQRSAVIALRNCLPAFFQLCAALPRVGVGQPRPGRLLHQARARVLRRERVGAEQTYAERQHRAQGAKIASGRRHLGPRFAFRKNQECRN
jgi:hypothetical protein